MRLLDFLARTREGPSDASKKWQSDGRLRARGLGLARGLGGDQGIVYSVLAASHWEGSADDYQGKACDRPEAEAGRGGGSIQPAAKERTAQGAGGGFEARQALEV